MWFYYDLHCEIINVAVFSNVTCTFVRNSGTYFNEVRNVEKMK